MRPRRLISAFLVVAGLAFLAAAGLYYFRGYLGQRTGLEAWKESRGAGPVPTLHVPTPTARENPGITQSLPTPSAAEAQARPYPQGQPVARLRIPSVKMDYVVFGGVDPATLAKGPGHVPGTELPGENTFRKNCVITGHRDQHFRRLASLRKGEEIELEAPTGATTTYRVVSREIVNPDAIRVLQATEKPRLTLITCYPFNYVGAAPHRIVFVAEPVDEPASPGASASSR